MLYADTGYAPLGARNEADNPELSATSDSDAALTLALARRRLWFMHGGMCVLYTLGFLALLVHIGGQPPPAAACIAFTSTYSPVLEAVEYETVVFNGTLDFPSPYRGAPSPAVDAAWDMVAKDVYATSVDAATLHMIGKPPRVSAVQFRNADGAPSGYMALYEVSHQLHCLNLLRKHSYREYYAPIEPAFGADPAFFRTHLDHCVEMLRQTLMCNADTGLVTFDWVADFATPYPDFNTVHRCRNFDKVMGWMDTHKVEARAVRMGDEVELAVAP